MKKSINLLFVLLLIIPVISAVEIKLSKDTYHPGETLQAEITGNFISLSQDNLLIYEENTPRAQPVISDLTKQSSIYYFYAMLPNQEGNFSLRIEDARYTESGVEKTNSIIKEFKIIRTNKSILFFKPGFIETSADFSIKLKSLTGNQQITAELGSQVKNYSLIEDIEKQADFSVSNLPFGKNELKLIYASETSSGFFSSSTTQQYYTIPVFVIEKTIVNNTLTNLTNRTINQTINISDLNDSEIEDYIEGLGNDTESLSCYDIGESCLENEECDGNVIPSIEGGCCIGDCIEQKKSSWGTIIGIILIILVLGFVVFVYLKSKKKQKPKSTDDILKEKEGEFQRRMRDESSEVVGRLGKV